ncbi:MAG: hypothetical protein Q8P08_00330 [bacterium]|nr:hypothetical protein [bacterium]
MQRVEDVHEEEYYSFFIDRLLRVALILEDNLKVARKSREYYVSKEDEAFNFYQKHDGKSVVNLRFQVRFGMKEKKAVYKQFSGLLRSLDAEIEKYNLATLDLKDVDVSHAIELLETWVKDLEEQRVGVSSVVRDTINRSVLGLRGLIEDLRFIKSKTDRFSGMRAKLASALEREIHDVIESWTEGYDVQEETA